MDTSRLGGPAVPSKFIREATADIVNYQKDTEKITPQQFEILQNLCYSARVAGTTDFLELEHVYDETGLSGLPLCETCEHHQSVL